MPETETDDSQSQTSPTNDHNASENTGKFSTKRDSSWPSVLFYIHLNILGLYGIIVLFTNTCFTTVIFTSFLTLIGILGVTCGAHRLWAHHAYTATTFLKIALILCQTMAGQVATAQRHLRVFAALGIATDLKTMTTDAVKTGLIRAVDTNRPVVDCLMEAGREALENIPSDHYLTKDKYK